MCACCINGVDCCFECRALDMDRFDSFIKLVLTHYLQHGHLNTVDA